jgi:hypothetical protein
MAVAADHEHARLQVTAFRQHDMADALAIVKGNAALLRPLPGQFEDACALVGFAGHEVVGNQDHLLRIEQADAELLQDRLDPARSAGIVDHGEIHHGGDDLARRYALAACGARDDLLCKCRFHHASPR